MIRITQAGVGLLAFALFVSAIAPSIQIEKDNYGHQPNKLASNAYIQSDSAGKDPETGLALDDQFMLVKGQCTACHSSKLILQSHFSREKWVERIRWMQQTQKLWDLGESEPAILTYLTKHYGPLERTFDGRREPLKAVKWYKLSK
ncbi:hypothetical protein [Spirosoma utsteinense]|uniref:Cytochrome c domain-containing protein n=1 Tax=Spirosoma utsteinense TaxID=2585773 RepID=A0ABR6W7A8_9BACT|nr:hypothetical protein [Spirosoma utsteinense]MBC3786250.1 hypothetical protein [Spirosoma utsteinense]MBC3791876.1 hypothetical protein [Spirosoma utsteinense]